MSDKYLAEPDLNFITEVVGLGGDSLKKCFQCATCSVVCPIAPDNKPFPRKEMVAASWGLRDRLTHDLDVWLCHQCGDCSTYCPRGAKPGDVLGAIRSYAIDEYATPKALGKAVNDPKKLPILIAIPAILFAILAFVTTSMGGAMDKIFKALGLEALGFEWAHHHPEDVIAHADFYSTWFVDLVFIPLSILVVVVFLLGLRRFLVDMHEQAIKDGKTSLGPQNIATLAVGTVKGIIAMLPTILKHDKFTECSENKERSTAHMMVLYGFIGLFIMTAYGFIALYLLNNPGPYPQWNPFKILANAAGIALVLGGILMIKNRLAKKDDQVSTYKDWFLLGMVLGLGLSGMLTELTRLAGAEALTYFMYYIHLIFIFGTFAYLPFSKLAHLVYRTVAMGYAEYSGREK
ncbi:MAG: quinone-interacting membrane-bound oxidoreductase complex subunit QmoC [Desulfosudaceae bacterium]